jgi:heme/copper-type cytochrome/quinol oxidase subunit 3
MSATGRKLIVGAEDLLGVIAFGVAFVGAVTTWAPPPEAAGGPPSAYGYIVTFALLSASVLFFLAARHLHKTGRFSPIRHMAPVVCVLLVPLFGLANAHL